MAELKTILKNERFHNVIINELKEIGVKYKEKKFKSNQEKEYQKRVFQTPLHMLEVANVILCDGSAVLVPKFLADACNRVLQNVEAEGIFRKAGSSLRQKEIRNGLEAGLPMNRTQHVIDIANVLKYFFRELPEPLIPQSLHEPLLRGMMLGENNLKAIFLLFLLLPQLNLNTLSFFMQFLKTVASYSDSNKMTSENLAIIFAPGIMPCSDIRSQRFNNHVKLVKILIDNADMIGNVPYDIIKKFQQFEMLPDGSPTKICRSVELEPKKKKKRRSEMFSGIRKLVESAMGSAENLDESLEKTELLNLESFANPVQKIVQRKNYENLPYDTPSTKLKKRKLSHCERKQKDTIAHLPSNSSGVLPSTTFTKDYKKSRLSLCGNRQPRTDFIAQEGSSMVRRWSFVGSGWPKLKPKNGPSSNSFECKEETLDTSSKKVFDHNVIDERVYSSHITVNTKPCNGNNQLIHYPNRNFSTLSQNEYDVISERVHAIESRISREFEKLRESLNSKSDILDYSQNSLQNAESVQNKFERIKKETVPLCSPSTDLLAKRLSRNLKVRDSVDKKIVRSPSARKIGTLRKRSHELSKISRYKSCRANSKSLHILKTEYMSNHNDEINVITTNHESPTILANDQESRFLETKLGMSPTFHNENWTSADIFFKLSHQQEGISSSEKAQNFYNTPQKQNLHSVPIDRLYENCPLTEFFQTPKLPTKSISQRKTQRNSEMKSNLKDSSAIFEKKSHLCTPSQEDGNGRASIARLRTQNAGMVMAKAKLFDGMKNETVGNSLKGNSLKENNSNKVEIRQSVFVPTSRKNEKVQRGIKVGRSPSALNVHKNKQKLTGIKLTEEKKRHIRFKQEVGK